MTSATPLDFNPDVLHRFALFSGLASDERHFLARCFRRRAFAAGDELTRQGGPAVRFYCLLAGKVDVLVRYPGADKEEKVAQLKEGQTVGDFSLADIGESTATTIAAEAGFALEGEVKALLSLFDRHPDLGKKVYKALSKQLVARVQEMNKNLFYLL